MVRTKRPDEAHEDDKGDEGDEDNAKAEADELGPASISADEADEAAEGGYHMYVFIYESLFACERSFYFTSQDLFFSEGVSNMYSGSDCSAAKSSCMRLLEVPVVQRTAP